VAAASEGVCSVVFACLLACLAVGVSSEIRRLAFPLILERDSSNLALSGAMLKLLLPFGGGLPLFAATGVSQGRFFWSGVPMGGGWRIVDTIKPMPKMGRHDMKPGSARRGASAAHSMLGAPKTRNILMIVDIPCIT
jgi:hypothetical protein